jgi:hypothetical protein
MAYRIINRRSGLDLGTYQGRTESEALEAMARDAGYPSYREMAEVAPVAEGDLQMIEVSAREEGEPARHYAAVWPYGRGVVDEAGRATCGLWAFESRQARDRYVENGPAYTSEAGYREAVEPDALPVGWIAADLVHVRRY